MQSFGLWLSGLAILILGTEATYQQTSSQGSDQTGTGTQTKPWRSSNQAANTSPVGPVPIPLYIPPHTPTQTGNTKQKDPLPDVVFVLPVSDKSKNQAGQGTNQGSTATHQSGYNTQATSVQHVGYAPSPTSNLGQATGYGSTQQGSGRGGGSNSGYVHQNTNTNSNSKQNMYSVTQQGTGYGQRSSNSNSEQNHGNRGGDSSGGQAIYQNIGTPQQQQTGYGSATSNTNVNSVNAHQQTQTGYGASSTNTGSGYGSTNTGSGYGSGSTNTGSGYGAGSTNSGSTGATGYGQVHTNAMMSAYGPNPLMMMMLNRQRAGMAGYGQRGNANNQDYVMTQASAAGGYGTLNSGSNTGAGYGVQTSQQNTGYATNTNNQGSVYALMDTTNQGSVAGGYGSVQQPSLGMPMFRMPSPGYHTLPTGMQNGVPGFVNSGDNSDSGSGRKTIIKVALKPTISDGAGYGDKIPEVSYTILRTYPDGTSMGSTTRGTSSSGYSGTSSLGQSQGSNYGTSSSSGSNSFIGSSPSSGSGSYGGSTFNNKRGSFGGSGIHGGTGSSGGYSSASSSSSFDSFSQNKDGYGGYQPAPPNVYDICEADFNFDGFCTGRYPGLYSHPNPSCFLQCDHLGSAVTSLCAPGTVWLKDDYEPSTTNRCMHNELAASGEY